jgi:putative membrane protein
MEHIVLGKILIYLVANAATLVILSRAIPNEVNYNGHDATVVIFAVVLTLLNVLVKPVLKLITLPLSCLTLGLFALVVNAFVFYVGARFVTGITISYLGALVGAVVASLLNGALNGVLKDRS